jgi:hypothetical protein
MKEPAPVDPDEVIVGSSRLPSRVLHVPALVWVFAAVALGDALVRAISYAGGRDLHQTRPFDAVLLFVSSLPQASFVFLPGAVLLGRSGVRSANGLFQGALLLAAAELVSLGIQVLTFGPLTGAPAGAFDFMLRARAFDAVRLVAALLGLAGACLIAIALRPARSAPGGSRQRNVAAAILVVALAGAAAGAVMTTFGIQILLKPPSERGLLGLVITLPALISIVVGVASGLVWGVAAFFAIRADGPPLDRRRRWLVLSVALALIVISQTIAAVMGALPLNSATANLAGAVWLNVNQLNQSIWTVGLACLVAAFAMGVRPWRGAEQVPGRGEPSPA